MIFTLFLYSFPFYLLCSQESKIEDALLVYQLRLSEERYHLAMDAVEDGVWDWYIGSEQVACNPALYTMLDYSTHDFDSSRSWIFSLIHPEDIAEQQKKIQYLFKNPHTDFESEFRMRCKNNNYIWILSRGRIVEFTKHGRPKRILGTNKDITRQKENEEALVEAKKEAEEASLSKSQFLANMSHEIRTPMNAFIGMLQLLRNTELTAQQQDYISKAYNSSHILLNIINDILNVSKIEAGKLNLEHAPFSMRDVIEHAIELTVLPAHQKNIEILLNLDISTQLTCFGDSLRLSQILINLLANAVKFTETGEIELGCQQLVLESGSVKLKFWVKDTGIGLSDKQQKMLFEAFTQADGSMTRRFGGTGLGLSICKHLIQLMGGRIQVESALQQGAMFSFELEFEQEVMHPSIEEPSYPTDIYNNKVALIVDDNEKGLAHYSNYLKQLGFITTTAKNLTEFLNQAHQIQPDLLVVDHSMKEIQAHDSIQSMQDLLAHPSSSKPTHLLLMTHYNSKVNPAHYTNFNAFASLQKPFDIMKLSQTLEPLFVHEQKQHAYTNGTPESSEKVKHKLLLVEDNLINQQVASELLRSSGYHVDIADNGLIALDYINKHHYDLILMDLQMPEMDGFTATEEIRKHYSAQTLPIIAMTAHAMETDRDKSKSIGMNDYVTKPFVLEQLLQTLDKWIEPQSSIALTYKDTT